MKSLIIYSIICFLALTSCQQKQYAFVQQGKIETFESPQKGLQQQAIQQPNTEFINTESIIYTTPEITINTKTVVSYEDVYIPNNNLPTNVFAYNQESINNEFVKLNKLEAFVNANEAANLTTIQETDLLKDISLDTNTLSNITNDKELPLNIPAFLWGCFFGVFGVILVHIFTEDKEQTKKAAYGCLTAIGVVALIYAVLLVIGLSSASY